MKTTVAAEIKALEEINNDFFVDDESKVLADACLEILYKLPKKLKISVNYYYCWENYEILKEILKKEKKNADKNS